MSVFHLLCMFGNKEQANFGVKSVNTKSRRAKITEVFKCQIIKGICTNNAFFHLLKSSVT